MMSLKKRDFEPCSVFLQRVRWVIENVLIDMSKDDWTMIHFLLGLSAIFRESVLKQLTIVDDLQAIVVAMDGCKQEVNDDPQAAFDIVESKLKVDLNDMHAYDNNEIDPFDGVINTDTPIEYQEESKFNIKAEVEGEQNVQYFGCEVCTKIFTTADEMKKHK